jgi:hypothetical protein
MRAAQGQLVEETAVDQHHRGAMEAAQLRATELAAAEKKPTEEQGMARASSLLEVRVPVVPARLEALEEVAHLVLVPPQALPLVRHQEQIRIVLTLAPVDDPSQRTFRGLARPSSTTHQARRICHYV